MAKGEKTTTVGLSDAKYRERIDNALKAFAGFVGGSTIGSYVDGVPHEVAHVATAKALGYDSNLEIFASYPFDAQVEILGNPSALEGLLMAVAGPVASGVVSLASLLAFMKLKKNPQKSFFAGTSFVSSVNNAFYSLGLSLNDHDYIRMTQSIEELGYGNAGQLLPILPIAVTAYCNYIIGKEYLKSYKKLRQKEETVEETTNIVWDSNLVDWDKTEE